MIEAGAGPMIAELLTSSDAGVVSPAVFAVYVASRASIDNIDALVEAGIAYCLVKMLASPDTQVLHVVIKTIANILASDELQV